MFTYFFLIIEPINILLGKILKQYWRIKNGKWKFPTSLALIADTVCVEPRSPQGCWAASPGSCGPCFQSLPLHLWLSPQVGLWATGDTLSVSERAQNAWGLWPPPWPQDVFSQWLADTGVIANSEIWFTPEPSAESAWGYCFVWSHHVLVSPPSFSCFPCSPLVARPPPLHAQH